MRCTSLDISSFIGLFGSIGVLLYTIMLSGSLLGYLDAPSIVCTFGGTIMALFYGYPVKKIMEAFKALKIVFMYKEMSPENVIISIIELANVARKEGLLALEEAAHQLKDDFLQKGILLIVDGTDPELVRNILETELSFIEDRHKSNQGVFEFMATMGPGFGMLGTLIGLINMLANLSDPATIGPNMAIAILTTLYGSMIANVLCNPAVNKMKLRSSQETLMKEVMMEGMLSIQAGENPRIIEEKLKAFMAPKLRQKLSADKEPKEGE